MLKISAVLVPIVLIIWFNLPPELKAYTFGFDAEQNRNIELRYMTLQQTQQLFSDNPVFGAGLGLRKNIDATNVAWLALAETGVLGALAFAWIFWNFYRLIWRARKILPPSDPRFTLLSLGAALMTYKLAHGMVDHYWTRGALTNAWAGFGMILCYCRIPLEARARELHALAERKRAAHALASAQRRSSRRELAKPLNLKSFENSTSQRYRQLGWHRKSHPRFSHGFARTWRRCRHRVPAAFASGTSGERDSRCAARNSQNS